MEKVALKNTNLYNFAIIEEAIDFNCRLLRMALA